MLPYRKDRLVVITPAGHPLAERAALRLRICCVPTEALAVPLRLLVAHLYRAD
jgi:hypothetical protein